MGAVEQLQRLFLFKEMMFPATQFCYFRFRPGGFAPLAPLKGRCHWPARGPRRPPWPRPIFLFFHNFPFSSLIWAFPLSKEAPHKIWLWLAKRFRRRRSLSIVNNDGRQGPTDAGQWVSYKLTYEPLAQVSWKRSCNNSDLTDRIISTVTFLAFTCGQSFPTSICLISFIDTEKDWNISRDGEKTCLWGFPTRSDTNLAVQPQKIARSLKFRIQKVEGFYYLCSKNKGANQLQG